MTNQIGWQESEGQRVRHLAKDGGENAAGSKYIPQCHYDFYYWETEDEEPQTGKLNVQSWAFLLVMVQSQYVATNCTS